MSEATLIKYNIKNEQRFKDCKIRNIKQQSNDIVFPPAQGNSISIWLEFGKSKLTKVEILHKNIQKITLNFRLQTKQMYQHLCFDQSFIDSECHWSSCVIPKDIAPLLCDELNIRLTNQMFVEGIKMGIKFVKLSGYPIQVKSSPPKNLSVDSEFKPSKSQQKKLQGYSKPYSRDIFKKRDNDSKKKVALEEATGQLTLKEAIRREKPETESEQLQKVLKLSLQTAQKDKIMRTLLVPDDLETLSSKTEMIDTEIIEKPQLDYRYNKHRLEQWQVRLLEELTDQYKQLQQIRQIELNIKEDDRISNYMPGNSYMTFEGDTLVISGYEGIHRDELRKKALSLGMQYSDEVCDNCILVANFPSEKVKNAAKFKNVTIVKREYVDECSKKKKKLPFGKYLFILDQ